MWKHPLLYFEVTPVAFHSRFSHEILNHLQTSRPNIRTIRNLNLVYWNECRGIETANTITHTNLFYVVDFFSSHSFTHLNLDKTILSIYCIRVR